MNCFDLCHEQQSVLVVKKCALKHKENLMKHYTIIEKKYKEFFTATKPTPKMKCETTIF